MTECTCVMSVLLKMDNTKCALINHANEIKYTHGNDNGYECMSAEPTVFYMRSVVCGAFFFFAVACVKYECVMVMVSCVQNSLETFLFGKSGGP